MYTRPSLSDYDDWEMKYHNLGWGSKDLLPLIQKVRRLPRVVVQCHLKKSLDRNIPTEEGSTNSRLFWASEGVVRRGEIQHPRRFPSCILRIREKSGED